MCKTTFVVVLLESLLCGNISASGTIAAAILATHFYQQSGWWADNRAPFHFQEDF
jgi:hypothetical protein